MVTTKGVRVASGNLCEAEAPTEATAETKPENRYFTEENTMNAKTERQIENLKKQTIGVPTISARADTNTPPAETATVLGRLGMHRAENGNFKRMSALQDAMPKSANWSHRFFTTATLRPCRNWSESFARLEQ